MQQQQQRGETYRAHAIVDVKGGGMNEEQRLIEGWATTPQPDRADDIVDAEGVRSLRDIPLFLYHDSRLVVGRTELGKASKKGVPFTARLPLVSEVGALRDRIEEAWQAVKYKLITGVSIGFRPVWGKSELLPNGGMHFHEVEVVELSLVPIPMNAGAVITQFRSASGAGQARAALLQTIRAEDRANRRAASGAGTVIRLAPAPAAPGTNDPGASGISARRKGVVYLRN